MPRSVTLERQQTPGSATPPPGTDERRRRLRPPSLATLVGLVFALCAFTIALRPLIDNSFLWHLATGHQILDHGIPKHDLFSFTAPDVSWVTQSWLAEVLYAGIDRALGPFGLRLLRAGTSALLAYLVFRLALRLAGDRTRAALLTLVALGASFMMWAERPLLLGAVAMVVLLWIVEVPDSLVGRHPLVSLPVLLWLWANVHGSFALGFAYLGLHLAGRWLDGVQPWRGRERTLLMGSALALVACLANPLGTSLLTFPLHMLAQGDVLKHIREWQSPDFHSFRGMLFGLWIAVFAVTLARGRTRCSRRDLLVSVVFLLLALWAVRNLIVAPLIGLPIAARALAVDRGPETRMVFNWAVFGLLVLLGFSAASGARAEPDYNFSGYPVKAMDVVDERGLLGGHLLTTYEWAAYVIHQYWPQQKVFIDDRFDMYPTRLAEEYFVLNRGGQGWHEILDRHGIDVIVWKTEKPLAQLLDADAGWERIYGDDLSGVWVKH